MHAVPALIIVLQVVVPKKSVGAPQTMPVAGSQPQLEHFAAGALMLPSCAWNESDVSLGQAGELPFAGPK